MVWLQFCAVGPHDSIKPADRDYHLFNILSLTFSKHHCGVHSFRSLVHLDRKLARHLGPGRHHDFAYLRTKTPRKVRTCLVAGTNSNASPFAN
jgi:hypothetical protein